MHLEATAPGKMLCSKVFHWCLLLYICPYWPIHIVELIQYNACGSEFVSSIKIGSWGCVQFEKWVNRDQEPQKIVQWGGGQPTPTPNVPLQEITLKDSKTMSKGMTNRRFEHNTFGGERVYMLMRVLIDLQRTHCLFPNKDHCLFPNKDRSNVLQLYMLKPCPEYPGVVFHKDLWGQWLNNAITFLCRWFRTGVSWCWSPICIGIDSCKCHQEIPQLFQELWDDNIVDTYCIYNIYMYILMKCFNSVSCWWKKFWNPSNQLRLVVYPISCKVSYMSGGTQFLRINSMVQPIFNCAFCVEHVEACFCTFQSCFPLQFT